MGNVCAVRSWSQAAKDAHIYSPEMLPHEPVLLDPEMDWKRPLEFVAYSRDPYDSERKQKAESSFKCRHCGCLYAEE